MWSAIRVLAALAMISAPNQTFADGAQLDELPFHRVIDIEVGLGLPTGLAGGIELHPTNHIHVETTVAMSAFFFIAAAEWTANVKYRWDLRVLQKNTGSIGQRQFGPGIGIHLLSSWVSFFGVTQEWDWLIDAMVSLETTRWRARHLGFSTQLDVGGSVPTGIGNATSWQVSPLIRFKVGLAI